MADIIFKKEYVIRLDRTTTIIVNPYEAIKKGFKKTTLRIKPLKTGIYKAKHGSYYKPIYWDYKLHIYRVRVVSINELTDEELKEDIGLTDEQFELLTSKIPIKEHFLQMLIKFNKRRIAETGIEITLDTPMCLHYFKIVDDSDMALDKFL